MLLRALPLIGLSLHQLPPLIPQPPLPFSFRMSVPCRHASCFLVSVPSFRSPASRSCNPRSCHLCLVSCLFSSFCLVFPLLFSRSFLFLLSFFLPFFSLFFVFLLRASFVTRLPLPNTRLPYSPSRQWRWRFFYVLFFAHFSRCLLHLSFSRKVFFSLSLAYPYHVQK